VKSIFGLLLLSVFSLSAQAQTTTLPVYPASYQIAAKDIPAYKEALSINFN
jgi:hypothetical protein